MEVVMFVLEVELGMMDLGTWIVIGMFQFISPAALVSLDEANPRNAPKIRYGAKTYIIYFQKGPIKIVVRC